MTLKVMVKVLFGRKIFRSFYFRDQNYGFPFKKIDLAFKWPWRSRSWSRSYSDLKFSTSSRSGIMFKWPWRSWSRSPLDVPLEILQFLFETFFSKVYIFRVIDLSKLKWDTLYIYDSLYMYLPTNINISMTFKYNCEGHSEIIRGLI